MNGKELLLSALRCEPTPRAAWVPFVGVHGASLIGESAPAYLRSSELLVRGLERARERYRPDGLPLVFDLQLEAEVLGCTLRWSDETPPTVISHPLSAAEPGDLPPFDPGRGRYPLVAEALRRLRGVWGDEVALYGLITGPFTLALHLLGTEIFLTMFDEPDRVRKVLDFCAEVGRRAADFYLEEGADVIAVVDPMTSQISSAHFTGFVAEPIDTVFDRVREKGGLSSLFVCGNATRNLEAMCATRCDNLSVDENISLLLLRALATARGKSFGGNLKLTTVLLLGNEADARRDTLRCLDAGGEAGFVLAPGCDLPFATPEANLAAVAELVHDPYQREVARATVEVATSDDYADVVLPDYTREEGVVIDVITLDSASCAPCQYMVAAVERAVVALAGRVTIREHKITTRAGLGHMARLGVGQIPTICIDGEVKFPSIIPDIETLVRAIARRLEEKERK